MTTFTTADDTGPTNDDLVDQPAPQPDTTSTRCQINLIDTPDRMGVTVEMMTSNTGDAGSPSNVICAFIGKYWEIICASAAQEYRQAEAELSGKLHETAPKLVTADGTGVLVASKD